MTACALCPQLEPFTLKALVACSGQVGTICILVTTLKEYGLEEQNSVWSPGIQTLHRKPAEEHGALRHLVTRFGVETTMRRNVRDFSRW